MWIINGGDEIAKPVKSRDYNDWLKPKVDLEHHFRMTDGDDNIIYYGWCDDYSFDPLDDFGKPNFGCTGIQYIQNGVWEDL